MCQRPRDWSYHFTILVFTHNIQLITIFCLFWYLNILVDKEITLAPAQNTESPLLATLVLACLLGSLNHVRHSQQTLVQQPPRAPPALSHRTDCSGDDIQIRKLKVHNPMWRFQSLYLSPYSTLSALPSRLTSSFAQIPIIHLLLIFINALPFQIMFLLEKLAQKLLSPWNFLNLFQSK